MSNPMLRDFGATSDGRPQQGQYAQNGRIQEYGQSAGQVATADKLQGMYDRPAAGPAQTGRMTMTDVVMRTAMTLGTVVVFAVIGWFVPALMLPGLVVGFVLGLVNAFKREPSPVLIMTYAAAEGLFLGGLSMAMEYSAYPGIVMQAVIGTFGVAAVVLVLNQIGILRSSPVLTKIVLVAMLGYLVFGLVNLGLSLFAGFNMRYDVTIPGTDLPMGLLIGGIAILLASYSLVLDYENIRNGVGRVASKYAWSAAFGLTVTLIWLYVEILRILAIFSNND
ncbi:Bax inhibitor-1/YccA family protein [Kocuria palustris]|uniref:Bax inhibitor-1/YccA family protein n=1 Tax=Kocuria palustris TaxID=71999 RepID=UPI0011A119AF|nr:Bax inhibitor-1/YccA family protein [Kocuria palustris]